MKHAAIEKGALQQEYEALYPARVSLMKALEAEIERTVASLPSHVMVKGRVKSFGSYRRKIFRYLQQSREKCAGENAAPPPIPDVIGLRIICPFIADTQAAEDAVKARFEIVEIERKGSGYSFKEFGYVSVHVLFKIPAELREKYGLPREEIAEVQIRTILQEAWAEVEHELVYKAEFVPFDHSLQRKLASVNATLTLADTIFQEIRVHQQSLSRELGKRHETFFKKIEEEADNLIFSGENTAKPLPSPVFPKAEGSTSIDDMLLNALFAHNRGLFDDAIRYYTKILDRKPEDAIQTLIYKHRGMAYFAQSNYAAAIADFTASFERDPSSYKSLYYRGIVKSVMRNYTDAVADFDAALAINPYQAYAFYRRAQARYHLADYTEALADVESALGFDKSIGEAQKLKQILLKKLKM